MPKPDLAWPESLLATDGVYHRIDPPRLHCDGWGGRQGDWDHHYCDGGTGLWVTRRGRWVRNGQIMCGACRRRDAATR